MGRHNTQTILLLLSVFFLVSTVYSHGHHKAGGHAPHDHDHHHSHDHSSTRYTKEIAGVLSLLHSKLELLFFGTSPAVNSFLATFYISVFPNLLLLFVPSNIKASSLNILVSFAIGGLLGDVFLHLLPHAFLENADASLSLSHEQLTLKNICIGLAIFFGMVLFYIMDKVMRIVSGDSGHGHSHSHDHTPSIPVKKSGETSNHNSKLRKRKTTASSQEEEEDFTKEPVQVVKHSAYLNLIADFSHNFTDGIAISASFYHSRAIGISTTLAVFLHEIPHEVGDFAILLQAGFSRVSAMYSQFITAIGAFLGTIVGVYIQEFVSSSTSSEETSNLFSSIISALPISPKDLVLPITAGGFLYIATVSVIPDLLQTPSDLSSGDKEHEKPGTGRLLVQLFTELFAMFLGVSLMALVSLAE